MDEAQKRTILGLLERHRVMSIATLRPDGWPQVTTVGYANAGLTIYFLCGRGSQKAANLARDDRVSFAIGDDPPQVMEIAALSMAARAERVSDREEAARAMRMLIARYPEQTSWTGPPPSVDDVAVFRLTPVVASVIDYSKGFGHADLVADLAEHGARSAADRVA